MTDVNPEVSSQQPASHSTLMHIAINAIDVEETLSFYRNVFGYERTYQWTRAEAVDSDQVLFEGSGTYLDVGGGAFLELFDSGTAGQSMLVGTVPHFSLTVADIDAVYEKALNFGAKPNSTTRPTHWDGRPTTIELNGDPRLRERVAYIEGLNGEAIELYQVMSPIVAS